MPKRVELAVRDMFPGMSRREAIALCEAGAVKDASGKRLRKGASVEDGHTLEVDLRRLDDRQESERAALQAKEQDLVWLDSGPTWAVIRKPAGLGSLQRHFGDTLHFAEFARRLILAKTHIDTAALPDLGLVHRLDNGTSGACVFALDAAALHAFVQDRGKTLFRTYWAMARNVPADAGEVSTDIEDQSARTHYKVLARDNGIALFEARIEGGRRHQIRIHMASLGAPLLGDGKYGETPAARLALHAQQVTFEVGGQKHVVSALAGEHFWAFAPALRR